MFTALFFIKLFVAIAMVTGMSLLTEYVSPKIAGIISGYPTGTAISLFFFGIEQSPEFAAESAVYNMAGLGATCVFILVYYLVSARWSNMLLSSFLAVAAYGGVIFLINSWIKGRVLSVILPVVVAGMLIIIFRNVHNLKIAQKVKLRLSVLFFRAFVAAVIILAITITPNYVGSDWAGLFSAFPSTLFPLMLIIHYTYDKRYVHTIIKNVPVGLFSLILYSLTVSYVFPRLGVVLGTLFAYVVATVYLILFFQARKWIRGKLKIA